MLHLEHGAPRSSGPTAMTTRVFHTVRCRRFWIPSLDPITRLTRPSGWRDVRPAIRVVVPLPEVGTTAEKEAGLPNWAGQSFSAPLLRSRYSP